MSYFARESVIQEFAHTGRCSGKRRFPGELRDFLDSLFPEPQARVFPGPVDSLVIEYLHLQRILSSQGQIRLDFRTEVPIVFEKSADLRMRALQRVYKKLEIELEKEPGFCIALGPRVIFGDEKTVTGDFFHGSYVMYEMGVVAPVYRLVDFLQ